MNAAPWFDKLPPPDRWRGLALAHGPRIATWVLALALGVQAAMIVTDLTGGKPVAPADSSQPPPPPATAHVNVAAIANNHLFGSAEVEAKPAGDAANAPPTSIPLVLTGTIASDNPEAGLAILGDSATNTKFVPVGGVLPGGVKLHSVYKDRVVLDRNGTLESLMLPRQTGPSLIGANSPPPAMPTVENPVVDRVRQLIANEPGAISEIMRPQPVFAQGKQRGFRVYPGRNRQAFTRLGLRPGDLVTAINGTPLDDPSRGQEVFNTLSSSSEAHVTVMRNGRQQDLTLQLAQVAQEAEALVGSGNNPPPEQPPPPAEAPAPLPPPEGAPPEGGESQ
jgi:general secretion pathway protein C